jgi:phage-related protein
MPTIVLKPVEWIASSRGDLQAFLERVRRKIRNAVYRAQEGKASVDVKSLKGLGAGMAEVVADHDRNAYRAVYTVRFVRAVYVLHVFQKKSKKGISTPKHDIDLIRRRLKAAAEHDRVSYGKEPDDAESTNSNDGG